MGRRARNPRPAVARTAAVHAALFGRTVCALVHRFVHRVNHRIVSGKNSRENVGLGGGGGGARIGLLLGLDGEPARGARLGRAAQWAAGRRRREAKVEELQRPVREEADVVRLIKNAGGA